MPLGGRGAGAARPPRRGDLVIEALQHFVHNQHGEWTILAVLAPVWYFLRGFLQGSWRGLVRQLQEPRYSVNRQKVTPPFFNPQIEYIIYGPYRSQLWAIVVANIVCGPWDRVTVEEKTQEAR